MRAFLAAAFLAASPLPALASTLAVSLDQAVRIGLPRDARDVIVGNPAIADAAVQDSRHIILTGKSVGVTNLMVTDRNGRTMLSHEVVVAMPSANRVAVWRGPTDLSTYACAGRCERTAAPTASSSPSSPPAP